VTGVETRIIPEEAPPKFYAEHLKAYEFARDFVKGKKVLEVGCGDGYGSAYLAKVAAEVTGMDYEKDVILRAKNKYSAKNLSFTDGDATRLQFADESFDAVCSFQVIEHIPEGQLLRYLLEIRRVLKNDGTFYLSTLNLEHSIKSPITYQKNPAHCKEFTLGELKELLGSAFSDVKIYGLHLTLRHSFYQRMKKIGIFRFLPNRVNPVIGFYSKVTTGDFKITANDLNKAIDFICVGKKRTL
jgi:ubiquinone/menaquinone biosynthesis C-methylase UbiE